jgi:asparagine synthase (glutamine-hydrolysing)
MRFQAGWRFVPDQLKGAAAHLFAAASPKTDRHRKLASFIAGGVYFDHPYYIFRALFTPQQLARLLSLPIPLDGDNPWCRSVDYLINHAAAYDPINAISYLECRNYLVSTLLRDTDFMSMAHNLEVRVPLIDHKLVEYVIQLPGRLKGEWRMALGARIPKPLLIEALRGMLLPEVIYQPKRTFTFPWARWLKDELRREVEDALRTGSIVLKDVLNVKEVERLWAQFLAGRVSWSRVWALYVLQKWADRHLS